VVPAVFTALAMLYAVVMTALVRQSAAEIQNF
jgi:hypothetical protein